MIAHRFAFGAVILATCGPSIPPPSSDWFVRTNHDLTVASQALDTETQSDLVTQARASLATAGQKLTAYQQSSTLQSRCDLATALQCSVHRFAQVATQVRRVDSPVFQATDVLQSDLSAVDPSCPQTGYSCP